VPRPTAQACPPLLVRADATTAMGTGHLMRSLALAAAWRGQGGQVRLLTHCEAEGLTARAAGMGIDVQHLPGHHPNPADLPATLAALDARPGCAVVLDGYHFDLAYQRSVRRHAAATLVVDDAGGRDGYDADLLLNQNLGAEAIPYELPARCIPLLGPRYALLRPEFLVPGLRRERQPERVARVVVTMGGADPSNHTGVALEALAAAHGAHPGFAVTAVVGAANPNLAALRAQVAALPLPVDLAAAPEDMPGLLAAADLAVSAAGSTVWELAYLGVPTVAVVIADNQARIAAALDAAGAAVSAGEAPDALALTGVITRLLEGREQRAALAEAARGLVDGRGAARVAEALAGEALE
jgi:UDP-2,4-diacetamido-2,4,6-trideoxy-beta-L-altropyranose hydrolase